MDMDNSVVIWGESGIVRGLNGYRKKTIKKSSVTLSCTAVAGDV